MAAYLRQLYNCESMTDLARLAHVMIFAKHLEPMAAFYQRAFDMTREPSSDPGFMIMRTPSGAGIALHALPPRIADEIELTSPPRWRDDTAYKVCFEVADLDAQRKRITDHGGQVKEPWTWEGTRFCECADPEGNALQIFVRRP